MSDHNDPLDISTTGDAAVVDAWLARAADPEGTLWVDAPRVLEDELVATINGLEHDDPPMSSPRVAWWLAAAAAIVMVITGVILLSDDDTERSVFALAGTENAPNASAEVEIAATPVGLKLLLDPTGLPGAPTGTYYEAWVSDGDIKVSAGTFHLRGGEGTIELWAGVAEPSFTMLAVTLEPLDGDLDSSGDVYLRGTFSLDG